MPSLPLQRTSYRDLTFSTTNPPLRTEEDPLNTTGSAALRDTSEDDRDLESYQRPLEQIHASGLHEWGISSGLVVSAQLGMPTFNVKQGIAIDALGRHISMAIGGTVELDPNAPTNPPTPSQPVAVTASGVNLTVPANTNDDFFLTIEFRETFDASDWSWTHMPLLWLQKASTFIPDGIHGIPLALVTVQNNRVTQLVDASRRLDRVPTGTVHLVASSRRLTGDNDNGRVTISDPDAGFVRGLSETADGARGIGLAVPSRGAVVRMEAEVPQAGTVQRRAFAEASVRASDVFFQRDDGKTTARVDTDRGNIVAGGDGVEGDVLVVGANDQLMVTLDGSGAGVIAGGQSQAGYVRVLDSTQAKRVELDGATGDVWFEHALRDPSNPAAGPITHPLLQNLFPLTNGSTITTLHNHPPDLVGDATKAFVGFMFSTGFHTQTLKFSLTSSVAVAFIMLSRVVGGPAVVASISDVDGSMPPTSGFFGGDIYSGPITTSITFTLTTSDLFSGARANCVIFVK